MTIPIKPPGSWRSISRQLNTLEYMRIRHPELGPRLDAIKSRLMVRYAPWQALMQQQLRIANKDKLTDQDKAQLRALSEALE
jgi:hypothetical protein